MKKQILTLIIGILIGAIITTGVFLIIKANSNQNGGNMGGQMGEPPSMDGNSMPQGGQGGQQGEPPAKPGESTTNSTTSATNTSVTNSNT